MKNFIEKLGKHLGWLLTALVAILALFGSLGLPFAIDLSSVCGRWALLMSALFLCGLSFAAGFVRRGEKNERDIRLAAELEKARQADEARSAAQIAQIEADKELQLERMRQERAARKEEEARVLKATEQEVARRRKINQFSDAELSYMLACYCEQRTMRGVGMLLKLENPIADHLVHLGVFHCSEYANEGGKFAFTLASEWCTFVVENEEAIREKLNGSE